MPLLSSHPPIKQQTTMGCNPIPTYPPQALKGSDDSSHQKNNLGQHHSIHGTEDPKPCGRPALIFTILRSAFAVKDLAMAKAFACRLLGTLAVFVSPVFGFSVYRGA